MSKVAAHPVRDPELAIDFILAGDARFTIVSTVTGTRYTYNVTRVDNRAGDPRPTVYFVSVLYGPDNTEDFLYLGIIREVDLSFGTTRKSRVSGEDARLKAFAWMWANLVQGRRIRAELEIWHQGRCGRCRRALTVPESIQSGIGPECAKKARRFSAERVAA